MYLKNEKLGRSFSKTFLEVGGRIYSYISEKLIKLRHFKCIYGENCIQSNDMSLSKYRHEINTTKPQV